MPLLLLRSNRLKFCGDHYTQIGGERVALHRVLYHKYLIDSWHG